MYKFMRINSVSDLRTAYGYLRICEAQNSPGMDSLARDIKADIRDYLKPVKGFAVPSETIFVMGDSDSCIVRISLPDWIETTEQASDFFRAWHYMEYAPSPYDCTGQLFTNWFKVCKLHGQWYAYHSYSRDV